MRYAVTMKYLKQYLPFLLLLLISTAGAEMYKHTDADGVTTYTDTEVEGATQIKPPEGNTIKLPRYVAKQKSVDSPKSAYTAFSIVSPVNDSTVRDNNGAITLTLSITPELDTESGHSISAYIDSKKAVSNSTSLSITVENADRGTHSIYAGVSDADGKLLIQSNSITIHLKKYSSLH